jgi:chromosome segregation ATPase
MSDQQEQQQQFPCPPGQDPSPNLDDQLKKLEQGLQEKLEDMKTAEIAIAEHEDQIKALSSLISTIDGVVENYRQKHLELKEKDEDYKKFCTDEKQCLSSTLGEKAQRVCEIAQSMMSEIITIATAIEKLEVGCDDAKGELEKEKCIREKRRRCLAETRKALEAWNNPVKTIEARFKNLDSLKKEICDEHEVKNHATAYYLLMFGDACCAPVKENESCWTAAQDLQELFESFEKYCKRANSSKDYPPEVVDPADLKQKILDAWNAYKSADASYNEQDAKVKSSEKKLELMKAQLEEKKKNFEKTIRRKLSELDRQSPQTK